MTAREMGDKIVAKVSADPKGVSVCELVEDCGSDARGNLTLEFKDNLVLWKGVSDLFARAIKLALPHIKMAMLPPILVHALPERLDLPIAKQIRPYKTARWLPVVLLPKGSRRVAEARRGKKLT
jgi:hypothetical protein